MSGSFEPGPAMDVDALNDLEETIEARRAAAFSRDKLAMARLVQRQIYLGSAGPTALAAANEPNDPIIDLNRDDEQLPGGTESASDDEEDDSMYAQNSI